MQTLYGTLQDLANQGYQVSGGKVYNNGVVIANYGGVTAPSGGGGSTTPSGGGGSTTPAPTETTTPNNYSDGSFIVGGKVNIRDASGQIISVYVDSINQLVRDGVIKSGTMPIGSPTGWTPPGGWVTITPPEAGTTPPAAGTTPPVAEGTQPMTTLTKADKDRIKNLLDTQFPNLTSTEREFLESTFLNSDNYTSGRTIPTNEQISGWISDAATNAATDINPYYIRISKEELDAYKQSLADIRAKSQTFQTNEETTYQKQLATTKQQLRTRGLTFAGSAIKNVGSQAAVVNPTGYEGGLQTARRLDYEQNNQALAREAGSLTTAAEQRLGSAPVMGALTEAGSLTAPTATNYNTGATASSLATTTGNYSGTGSMAPTIEQERAMAIELAKQQRINQYRLTI